MGPHIGAGDYCPRCGARLTEYNELHRQSFAYAGGTRRPDTGRSSSMTRGQLAFQAISMAVAVGVTYLVMRFMFASTDATMTVNGEVEPLFDPAVLDAAFALVMLVAVIVFMVPHLPGYVKRTRRHLA